MFYPEKFRRFRLRLVGGAALLLTLGGLWIPPAVFAKIVRNTIDPVATITRNDRHIVVTGPVQCTAGETFDVRATLTQRTTGAMAEGAVRFTCTGNLQHWLVEANTRGKESFQAGLATAVAIGATTDRGRVTDMHQWLVSIILVNQ